MTAYAAEKCQAVINGYLDGWPATSGGARLVALLLTQRSLTSKGIPHAVTDPWPAIDALPWPPPPGLRPGDPDIQR